MYSSDYFFRFFSSSHTSELPGASRGSWKLMGEIQGTSALPAGCEGRIICERSFSSTTGQGDVLLFAGAWYQPPYHLKHDAIGNIHMKRGK